MPETTGSMTRRGLLLGATMLAGTKAGMADESLAAIAASRGLQFGAAASAKWLDKSTAYGGALAQDCRLLVGEGEMKWRALAYTRDQYDFSGADRLARFAAQHALLLRGHTLVWHEAMPDWLPAAVETGDAARILIQHIEKVVGRYKGKIYSWDVVNEALKPVTGTAEGLRPNIWQRALGFDYFRIAYETAQAADPTAQLVYNDFGMEYEIDWHIQKRRDCLKLLEQMRKKAIPCHAFGLQAHLATAQPFNAENLRRFLREVADLGYDILITELDVDDNALPADILSRDAAVAAEARRFLDVALDEPRVKQVLTWGITDQVTWLNAPGYRRRKDEALARPLPLDDALIRKPLWHAIAQSLRAAPLRR